MDKEMRGREAEQTTGKAGLIGDSGLRILKGKRKRKKLDSHRGKPDLEGKDVVVEKKNLAAKQIVR